MQTCPLRSAALFFKFAASYISPVRIREISLIAIFFQAQNDHPTILDCGSYGMSVLFFKTLYPGARIIGFEPDPLTFKILSQNVAQNDLKDVELHQCALSDIDGCVEFYRSTHAAFPNLHMSLLKERQVGTRRLQWKPVGYPSSSMAMLTC